MDPRDEALWTEQLLANAGWVRALARRLVADASAADDVVQQTWLAALTHPPSAARSLRPWLGRVLRVQVALRRRGRIHRRDREVMAARSEALPSAEELVVRTETQERLVRAVRELSEPYRSAIVLHFYEGLSAAEIARRRGVPGATVRSQIHRGLERLRADLDATFGDRRIWCLALAPLELPRGASSAPAAVGLPLLAKVVGLASVVAVCLGWLGWSAVVPLGGRARHTAEGPPPPVAEGLRLGSVAPPEDSFGRIQRTPASVQDDGGECLVRLIDQETGEPLPEFDVVVHRPGAEAWLARTDHEGCLRIGRSGTTGAWELELVDDTRLHQRAVRVHGAPLELEAPIERREIAVDTAEIDVAVPVGPTYELGLELPPGIAPADLLAHLRADGPPDFDTRKWAMHVAPVRPRGRLAAEWVRFAAVEASFLGAGPPWTLELTSADGYWSGATDVSSISGRHAGRLKVVLEPRARLRGHVLDSLGPVTENVLLHLLHADGSPTYRRVDTDGEGGFALAALEPGPYRLTIESRRHVSREVELSLEGGTETVLDCELVRAAGTGAVDGLLTSRTGRYRGRVVVVLASTEVEGRRFFATAAWQPSGDRLISPFAFDEVPGGRYLLQAFACDDQLPWEPRDLELYAPRTDLRLECRDDLETTSLALHAADAASGKELGSFTIVYSIDGGPEVVLEQVRPDQAARPDDRSFEWRVRFAGVTWALRSGPAQIPRAPRGLALHWAVFAEGHAPAFGDETAFLEEGGRLTARVALERGWGCRLRTVADDAARRPLGGVELWADGRYVATSRPDGRLECRLAAAPGELELRRAGWSPRTISPSPRSPRLFTEVRLRR